MLRRSAFPLLLALLSAAAGPAGAAEGSTLTIMYQEKPPFLERGLLPGSVRGPVAERVEALADLAGIDLRWVGSVPRSRIMAAMEAGEPVCMPNVRMTPDRAALFKFTRPIFKGGAQQIYLRSTLVGRHPTLESLMQDREAVLGVLLGNSLGQGIDALVARHAPPTQQVRGGPSDLLKLLVTGRVDYIVANADDMAAVAASNALPLDGVATAGFPDIPQEEAGRIMCSRNVPDAAIQRIDAVLAKDAKS